MNKIKGLFLFAALLACGPRPCFAAISVSDIGYYLYDNTKVTLLQGAHPAYFYDLGEGSGKTSQGGVIDHVLTYKFISADIGWRSSFSGSAGLGVGGVGIQFDQLAALVVPPVVNYINSVVPESMQTFWKSLFVGMDTGWDTGNGAFRYALHTGIEFGW